MDSYCWSEIEQFINRGKEILNVSFNEQVHAVLNGYETLRFEMVSVTNVSVVDANDNLCIIGQKRHDDKMYYKVVIGRGETRYVYRSCDKRYKNNNYPRLLASFSDELQSFITSFINNITILDSIFDINKQKYDEVIDERRDWGMFTLNKLREILKTKASEIKFRRNKFIIKILDIPFIHSTRLGRCGATNITVSFTVDRKLVQVRFDVGKFDEYTFIIYDDESKHEYYKYKSRNNTIHKTILDEKFNNYSQDVKNVISIFSNPTTFNKKSTLEQIYNYYEKLLNTPFLYNYEKCILILLAAKHRQFFGVPYDVAKIISYFVLN